MNVDRPALWALFLVAMFGIGFAIALSQNRPQTAVPAPAVKKGPEQLPPPRVVSATPGQIHISVAAPGFMPAEIERAIAIPLERFLGGVGAFRSVRSVSRPGMCHFTVAVKSGIDQSAARAEAINAIQGAMPFLPPGTEPPVVRPRDPDALPSLWIALNSDVVPEAAITDLLKNQIREKLRNIPGIAGVDVRGGVERVTILHIKPDALVARGLTQSDVTDALAKANFEPALMAKVEDLENTVIATRNGMAIRLRDVAALNQDGIRRTEYARLGGRRCALAGIFLMDQGNKPATAEAIRACLRETKLPDDVKSEMVANAGERILLVCEFLAGTRIDEMEKAAGEIEKRIAETLPPSEIGPVLSLVLDSQRGQSTVQMLVPLAEGHTQSLDAIRERIRTIASEIPGMRLTTHRIDAAGQPEQPIRVRLTGKDLAALRNWSSEVMRAAAEANSGLVELSESGLAATPEIRLTVDREKAARVGLALRDVQNAFQAIVRQRTFQVGNLTVAIPSAVSDGSSIAQPQLRPEDIGQIPIPLPDGKRILLRQVANIELVSSPALIERVDGKRCVTITCNPAPGGSVDAARSSFRQIAEAIRGKLKLPPDCAIADE